MLLALHELDVPTLLKLLLLLQLLVFELEGLRPTRPKLGRSSSAGMVRPSPRRYCYCWTGAVLLLLLLPLLLLLLLSAVLRFTRCTYLRDIAGTNQINQLVGIGADSWKQNKTTS